MFIGHLAVGFGAKRWAPRTSLATLIAAPIFLDVLWPFFVLAGIEKVRIDPGNTKLNVDWSNRIFRAATFVGLVVRQTPRKSWLEL